ncbi:MAG TPA: sugar transferase [Candidatus Omnitrophota bacterium]|nr:exopolysaccharide biosynthesis polyprenyl glycosylphosphotransferase [Candidatus Omnitrophota bacterium]HQO57927.1 sugar transferase [Candidatus Omnitrophota bacterium]
MIKINKSIKQIFLIVLVFLATSVVITSAWAAMTVIDYKGQQEIYPLNNNQKKIDENLNAPRSRAPEPSTLALLGSSFVGMIISFVRKTYYIAKRALDFVLSVAAIIILSPLFLLTAFLIKLTSKGPVIFTQTRVGKDGRLFKIFKFRTMKVDAEKETGPVWAAKDDPRLIPVGKFLRKSHMDEIPQFFNVLRGEMSVIGPRPERPEFVAELKEKIPGYEKRLSVKPGITGLAQVWHRYDETIKDVRKKIKYDLLYIKKVCLWTDLQIFLRTFRVVLTGEGAR